MSSRKGKSMSKKVSFRWVSLIRDAEDHANGYFNDEATLRSVSTEVSIKQMTEALTGVRGLGRVTLPLKCEGCAVVIQDLTAPILLLSLIPIRDSSSTVRVLDKGPSLQWLLDHEEELNDTSSDNVLYIDSMAVRSRMNPTIAKDKTVITILDVSNIGNIIDELKTKYIDWLDGTFSEFLLRYGYRDKDVVEEASQALMVYQAAIESGFKDPKEVAATLINKHLIADLAMREVFAGIKNY